ncbi:MAG: hypothetical protein J0L78_16115 [Planctomycetes bacterium]|nr:hypothetical protein [Planctomycetota bacterium]
MKIRTTHAQSAFLGICLGALAAQPALASGTALRPGYPTDFIPAGISADGSAVSGAFPGYSGWPYSSGPTGQLWRDGAGFSQVGYAWFQPGRHAISADGNKIAGSAFATRSDPHSGACVWDVREATATNPLAQTWSGQGIALTPDGSTMVWSDNSARYGVFIWNGVTNELIENDSPRVAAVSSDGSVVAYYAYNLQGFRLWTRAGGLAALAPLPGMTFGGEDVVVSADGMRVYAIARTPESEVVVRWDRAQATAGNAAGAAEVVCSVPRNANPNAYLTLAGVSTDERTIVFSVDEHSYHWTVETGVQDFESFLVSRDIEFGAGGCGTVLCMNADASTFAGIAGSFWYLDLNNAPTFCPADFNFDRTVNDADFVSFAGAYDLFDCSDPDMPAACPSDINRDGAVDDADFVLFVTAYDTLLCD